MSLSRPLLPEPDKGSSQTLFLSLFLLLLAFFILLNTLSTIEPGRSNRVLESVNRAFPTAFRTEVGDGVLEADPGQVIGETTRARIGEIFPPGAAGGARDGRTRWQPDLRRGAGGCGSTRRRPVA